MDESGCRRPFKLRWSQVRIVTSCWSFLPPIGLHLMLSGTTIVVDTRAINIILLHMTEFVGIRETVLRELVQASAEVSATIFGKESSFSVMVHLGSGDKTVVTTRGNIRLFASLDTVAAFVGDLGLVRFYVDISHYRPGRLRGPRPDRAEALRHTRTRMQQQPLGLEI